MELRGFEPLTSSMPWKRATNCAIAPRCSYDSQNISASDAERKIECEPPAGFPDRENTNASAARGVGCVADRFDTTPTTVALWPAIPKFSRLADYAWS